jgi:hypothetical protein
MCNNDERTTSRYDDRCYNSLTEKRLKGCSTARRRRKQKEMSRQEMQVKFEDSNAKMPHMQFKSMTSEENLDAGTGVKA